MHIIRMFLLRVFKFNRQTFCQLNLPTTQTTMFILLYIDKIKNCHCDWYVQSVRECEKNMSLFFIVPAGSSSKIWICNDDVLEMWRKSVQDMPGKRQGKKSRSSAHLYSVGGFARLEIYFPTKCRHRGLAVLPAAGCGIPRRVMHIITKLPF